MSYILEIPPIVFCSYMSHQILMSPLRLVESKTPGIVSGVNFLSGLFGVTV